ncbi:hypothetical protein ECZU45_20770 [Escherichia coli]|nr:hypothetical protein ECZU45_20770 [Escherichia coli]
MGPVHQQPEKDHADEKEDQGDGQIQHIEIGKIGEALREAADTFITGRSAIPDNSSALPPNRYNVPGDDQRVHTGVDNQSGVDQSAQRPARASE